MTFTEKIILFPPSWTMDMASKLLRKHYKLGVTKWNPVVVTMPNGSESKANVMQFTFFEQIAPFVLGDGMMDMEITE